MLESNCGVGCSTGASEKDSAPNGDSLLACSATASSAVSATSAMSSCSVTFSVATGSVSTSSATGSLAGASTDAA